MILDSFILLVPILILTAGGFVLSRIYHVSQDTLVKVIVDFLMPMLIFKALYTSDISVSMVLGLGGVTSFVVLSLMVLSFIYCRLVKIPSAGFIPSIIFMNSGFLGIPLMQLWGGIAAMNVIVIYDQIQTIYIFTLGILIITGGLSTKGFKEMVKSPILWAIFAGFLCRFLSIPVWAPLLTTFDFGGNAAPPLAALAMGVSLGETKWHLNRHLLAGLILRIGGGFALGLVGCMIFNITGMERSVVLVASSLPSAVFSSVLPLRYGIKSDFAGTMVVISTLLGSLTIPLAFWLGQ